jgi:hypothetical protein
MSVVRYKTNPFLSDLVVNLREKQVRLGSLGKDSHVLVNESTGQTQGTHLVTYRHVDSEQFLKLFTKNIALTFDLTSPGIKAFNVLCWAVQAGALAKDEVALDSIALEDFLAAHKSRTPPLKDFSIATFKRGLSELETAKLIAKTVRKGRYFVNPSFVFNGDRVAFTTVIERKKLTLQEEFEAHGQQRLSGIDPGTGEILQVETA